MFGRKGDFEGSLTWLVVPGVVLVLRSRQREEDRDFAEMGTLGFLCEYKEMSLFEKMTIPCRACVFRSLRIIEFFLVFEKRE